MNRREFIALSATALISYAIGAGCRKKTETPAPEVSAGKPEAPVENLTLKNLQTAYEIETERMKRYAKYAEAADKEGKKKVAVLLRGESQTQANHRKHFTDALEKLNIKPVEPEIKEIEIADTIANIEKITGPDLDYKKTTFGGFKEQASKDNVDKAEIFFNTGGPNVVEVQLLMRDTRNMNISIIHGVMVFITCTTIVDRLTDNASAIAIMLFSALFSPNSFVYDRTPTTSA